MYFEINKHSTLPLLKLELISDGRSDFGKFFDKIQNANIYFTMTDEVTGVKRIAKKQAGTQLVLPQSDCVNEQYYITYQFTQKETTIAGRYIGMFEIEFLDGSGLLVVPIKETLFINVLNHGIMK